MSSTRIVTDKRFVFSAATLCCLLWGSAYPAIKNGYVLFGIATGDIPSKLVFAGYRFTLAGLALLVFARVTLRRLGPLSAHKWRQVTLLGLTQTSLQYVFFYVGLAYTTGVKGAIMNATTTFFSVLLAHFLYRNDRITGRRALGCLLGFAGVMAVNFGTGPLDFHFVPEGEGFVVLAAFVLSAAMIYGKKVSQGMDPVVMTGYQLFIGGFALTVCGYATGGTLSGFGWLSGLLLGYLVLLSSAAFALWSILLKYNNVGLVAPFNFLIPIAGAILSAIFLGENILEWKNAAALVLVCVGIWIVTRDAAASIPRR